MLNDQQIVFMSFAASEYALNKQGERVKSEQAFFTIITSTDTIDTKNNTTANSIFSSRNHPDYLAQGYIKTSKNAVEFVAFTTAEGERFAIVNSRLFDLNHGSYIFINTLPDGTMRSLQLKEQELPMNKTKAFVEGDLLKRSEIDSFFLNKDS